MPGDSLLFAAGSFAAVNILEPALVFCLLPAAAVMGDQANYGLGRLFGQKLFRLDIPVLLNQENLRKANRFYKKHGAQTIILGRFIPVIRSFVPFIAAAGNMSWLTFSGFSLIGASLWSLLFIFFGYFFGQIEFVKEHFYLVIIAVILISLIPGAITFLKEKRQA